MYPIVRFDNDGHVTKMFGSRMFSWPHGLHVDQDGNLWIAEAGTPNVADSESDARENAGWEKGIRVGKVKSGFVEHFIPDSGDNPSFTEHGSGPESLAVDRHGNIFAGEPRNHALQKYVNVWTGPQGPGR